jgi:hypothetical protein
VSSLKEVGLSSGFSRFFLLHLPWLGTYPLRGSPRLLCEGRLQDTRVTLPWQIDKLAVRSLKVCSPGPVAVVLVCATAPQVIPSCIRSPYGKRSGRLVTGRLTRYCFLRPSCEAELVPIRVTSLGDRPERIHDTPRTEQGPQGSWRTPRSMQSPLESSFPPPRLPPRHPRHFDS